MYSFLKSLQWRLVFILISITFVLMVFFAVYLNISVESASYDMFRTGIENGFRNWSAVEKPDDAGILKYLKDDRYAVALFYVSENKPLTIYNIKSSKIIYTWDKKYNINVDKEREKLQTEIEKSQNWINAIASISGTGIGDVKKITYVDGNGFFDYAVAKGDYILYFRYYKEEWGKVIAKFNTIILTGSLIAILIAILVGYILSKTITVPIVNLMDKAKKIADGDFDQVLQVKSGDEIGKLTDTFNYMTNELKNTLNEISSEKSKVETILNYMTDGVIAFNIKGEVIHVNPAAHRILGTEEFNRTFNEFSKKYGLGIVLEDILYLESSINTEGDIKTNNKFFRVYFAVFTDEEKKADGIIAVLRDVTEQQKLERMRREFVENVSHELKTPLTSIKSYAETLLDGALEDNETAVRFLEVINSEAERMTRLVKDLLQLSSIDNRQAQWKTQKIKLVDLVKNSITKIQIEAENKGQKIESYVIGNLPEIYADTDKIEQVVLNILSNAIKYTPAGGKITIYMGKAYNEVYMKVVDTGIGIPKEDLPRIFERFYRVDKARSREMGGTGLGLSIAREIIEAHGGTILINSESGKGTEVIMRLPVDGKPGVIES